MVSDNIIPLLLNANFKIFLCGKYNRVEDNFKQNVREPFENINTPNLSFLQGRLISSFKVLSHRTKSIGLSRSYFSKENTNPNIPERYQGKMFRSNSFSKQSFFNFWKTSVLYYETTNTSFCWTSDDMGFKATVEPLFLSFLTCAQSILHIHLWCDTCYPLDGQHGGRAFLMHTLAHGNASPTSRTNLKK